MLISLFPITLKMPSPNKIIIASAGSGKTTSIIAEAGNSTEKKCALITYTNNNTAELREKALELFGYVPATMTVSTWYRFLLRHFIRPYQRHLYEPKVRTFKRVQGRSAKYIRKDDPRYYFMSEGEMYMDKASQFACVVIEESGGLPLQRFTRIYDHLYIDEVQDLAGYDLDLLKHLIDTEVELTLVGDVRQATYRTNPSAKNSKYSGPNIITKFKEWCKSDHTSIEYQAHSYRCVQSICDFADTFYPELPSTVSRNNNATGHDGVFAVRKSDVDHYMKDFSPQPLRLKRNSEVLPGCPLNYGEAKGKGFERVLMFPHKKLLDVLKTGDVKKLGNSDETRAKVYVGITRAYQSVGIVVPDEFKPANFPVYQYKFD